MITTKKYIKPKQLTLKDLAHENYTKYKEKNICIYSSFDTNNREGMILAYTEESK